MSTRLGRAPLRRYSTGGTVLGILSIAVGVGMTAYVMGKRLAPQPTREHFKAYVPEYDVIEVPVPEKPVHAGTFVREVKVRREKFPVHQLPRGVVRDINTVLDKVVLVPLPGGLPIIDENLGRVEDVAHPMAGKIPPGMRAMTVKVDAASAVEGWSRGGSIVDVLLVEKARTTVVAEAVRVISADKPQSSIGVTFGAGDGGGTSSTATLLVTQEQCLAINTAIPLGRIAFALRSSSDDASWRATRFSSDELSGARKLPSKAHVGGVAAFGVGSERKQYALVDGRWIPADSLPPGFLGDSSNNEHE